MMFTNDFPTASPTWRHVKLEIVELWEEIKKFNLKGIRDEACDVYTTAMVAINTYTGIPMPLFWLRSAKVWIERNAWWEKYLTKFDLKFKPKYLVGGSNYNKIEKRASVLRLAIIDQQGFTSYCNFLRDHHYWEI